MTCPDHNEFVLLVEGQLPAARETVLREHIHDCENCYDALVELARLLSPDAEKETHGHDMTQEARLPAGFEGLRPEADETVAERFNKATVHEPGQARAHEEEQLLEAGAVVDHFRIIRLLGKGGMGAVYLARDTDLGRKVALKIVRDLDTITEETRQRFAMEARTTAKFNHPHIVTIYAVGEIDGFPYVALEYLEGQDLQERMTEQEIGIAQALRICMAVAEAVTEAHRNGVQHRDLKPANVLLPHDGRVRVVDFGLAHVAPTSNIDDLDEELSMYLTDGETARGTPAYMSPEQWLGAGSCAASDVWAIGLLLHELCYGRLPYDERNVFRLFHAVTGPEPVPCATSVSVPESISTLIVRCLDKDTELRPTAAQVAEALRDVVFSGQRRTSDDESPFRGLLPFAERHAAMFFGRDVEIDACVERLRHEPMITIVGASGAGKSSLVQAGIVPRLREQGRWLILRVRPGDDPIGRLAKKVLRARSHDTGSDLVTLSDHIVVGNPAPPDELETTVEVDQNELENVIAELRESPQKLGMMLRQIATERGAKILFFVDQLEEIFTLDHNPDIEHPYMEAIASAADEVADPVRVILVMRDDFLGRAGRSGPAVREALRQVVVLTPPDGDTLEKLIVEPLRALSHDFDDPTLPTDMIKALGHTAPLPLLQFAARRLWDERDREKRLILRSAYTEMGGLAGALVGHAEAVLKGLSSSELNLARGLMLRLVTPDRTRRVVSEYQILNGLPPEALGVLNRLTTARLVTVQQSQGDSGGDARLELAHESLVISWPTLARWISESRDDLVFLAEIEQAAALWDKRGQREAELWQGDALDEATRRLSKSTNEPSALVRHFAMASENRELRFRRRKRVFTTGLLLVFAAAAGLSWMQKLEADRQRDHAEAQRQNAFDRRTEAVFEGASSAFERRYLLEARAKLRMAAERDDLATTAVRGLWWRLDQNPLTWRLNIGSQLYGMALAPDERLIAAVSLDRAVYLIDSVTKATSILRGHSNQVNGAIFSHDGKRLATADWAGEVRIWNVSQRKLSRAIKTKSGGIKQLRFTKDDRLLLGSADDGTARLWDAQSGKEVRRFTGHTNTVFGMEISPDEKWVASASRDGTAAIYEFATSKRVATLRDHTSWVYSVAFNPDGTRLATAGKDGTVRLWDITDPRSPKKLRVLHIPGREVLVAKFNPDGTTLVAGDSLGWATTWRVSTGETVSKLAAHKRRIVDLVFDRAGKRMMTSSHDGTVALWRLDRSPPATPEGHEGPIYGMAMAPDGQVIATGGTDTVVRLWRQSTGEQLRVLRGHQQNINSLSFGPKGKRIVSGSNDRSVRIWDAETGVSIASLHGHAGEVSSVAYSPDGTMVASGSRDTTIALWEVATQKVSRRLTGHTGVVDSLAFSPDGKSLASASWDKSVRLWNVETGHSLQVMRGHTRPTVDVQFDRTGEKLVSSGWDGEIRVWDVASGQGQRIGQDPGRVYSTAFRPQGDGVLSASSDRHGRLWSLAEAAEGKLSKGRIIATHANEVNTVTINPLGTIAATGSDDHTVRTWLVESGRPFWRAPLALPQPARLLSHRGLQSLGTTPPQRQDLTGPYVQMAQRLVHGSASRKGDLICGLSFSKELLSWKLSTPGPSRSRSAPLAREVIATPKGCLMREAKRVVLITDIARPDADRVLLQGAEVTAIAWAAGRIVVATKSNVQQFDSHAKLLTSTVADAGTSAVTLIAHGGGSGLSLVLGYDNGSIEVRDREGIRRPFDRAAASRVVSLVSGPGGTVIAGHANGVVSLYDAHDGRRLRGGELHGQVVHLLLDDNGKGSTKLHAATDLASHLTWDLSVFTQDRCALLQQVWQSVPVVWRSGQPTIEPPPPDHPCRPARPAPTPSATQP